MRSANKKLFKLIASNGRGLFSGEANHTWKPVMTLRETNAGPPIKLSYATAILRRKGAVRRKREKRKVATPDENPVIGNMGVEAVTSPQRRPDKLESGRTVMANASGGVSLHSLWKSYRELAAERVFGPLDRARKRRADELSKWRSMFKDDRALQKLKLSERRTYLARFGTAWWEHRWAHYAAIKKDVGREVEYCVILKKAYFARWKVARQHWQRSCKELGRIPLRSEWKIKLRSSDYFLSQETAEKEVLKRYRFR